MPVAARGRLAGGGAGRRHDDHQLLLDLVDGLQVLPEPLAVGGAQLGAQPVGVLQHRVEDAGLTAPRFVGAGAAAGHHAAKERGVEVARVAGDAGHLAAGAERDVPLPDVGAAGGRQRQVSVGRCPLQLVRQVLIQRRLRRRVRVRRPLVGRERHRRHVDVDANPRVIDAADDGDVGQRRGLGRPDPFGREPLQILQTLGDRRRRQRAGRWVPLPRVRPAG